MKFQYRRALCDSEGKGLVGCLMFIVLLGIAIFLGITLIPVYYANSNLDSDIKTEVSRAGAHSLDDAAVLRDILDIARKNEIKLDKQNVKVQRMAGQIFIEINYSVPVDLGVMEHTFNFQIKASSFVGTL